MLYNGQYRQFGWKSIIGFGRRVLDLDYSGMRYEGGKGRVVDTVLMKKKRRRGSNATSANQPINESISISSIAKLGAAVGKWMLVVL